MKHEGNVLKTPAPIHILELLRLVQKRNRFVASAFETGFSLSEFHALTEIDAHPGLCSRDLAQSLMVDRRTVSRLLKKLCATNLVRVAADRRDSRERSLALTAQGTKAIGKLNSISNQHMEALTEHLSLKEQERLARYLGLLADGFDAPSCAKHPSDHRLRPSVRRLTRALGLLETSVLGSELNPLQWHILSEVSTDLRPHHAWRLADALGSSRPNLSIAVSNLEKIGLLVRRPNPVDMRKVRIEITAQGLSLLSKMQATAERAFNRELGKLSAEERAEMFELLAKFAGLRPGDSLSGKQGYSIERLESDELRQRARSFFLERLSKSELASVPELVYSASSTSFGLLRADNLVSVIEFQKQGPDIVAVNATWLKNTSPDALVAFLISAFRTLFQEGRLNRILIAQVRVAEALSSLKISLESLRGRSFVREVSLERRG